MNILYLSELNPMVCSGGGEIILRKIVTELINKGHNVVIKTGNDNADEVINIAHNFDVVLCADIFNEPMNPYHSWFDIRVINYLIDSGKYATFETGYTGTCSKDYSPCNITRRLLCPDCPAKNPLRKRFFRAAARNIFLSPLQAGLFTRHFDLDISRRHVYVPDLENSPPIFFDKGLERDIEILYVGVVCAAKGIYKLGEFIKKNNIPDEKVLIVGDSIVGMPSFGTYTPKMPREELISVYNRSRYFWADTVWCEAFGMTTLEAIACGCQPIFNKNNGCMSCFNYDIEKAKEHISGDCVEIDYLEREIEKIFAEKKYVD